MTIGTDALDWLAGGRDSVAFDWFPGASIERKLLRLVAAGLGVTINVFEAVLAPWEVQEVEDHSMTQVQQS